MSPKGNEQLLPTPRQLLVQELRSGYVPPCRGNTELFFAPDNETQNQRDFRVEKAQAFCGQCDIVGLCLETATQSRETHGIWGGVDFDQIRARRKANNVQSQRQAHKAMRALAPSPNRML